MIRALTLAWLVVAAVLGATSAAAAEKRVALVIGNSAYQNVARLPNPTNDAEDMAAKLESLGFEVRRVEDVGKAAMEAELADFADASAGADIAVVFYAGHGIEVDRQNYLIPVDARLETDRRLRFETLSLDDVLVSLEAVKGVRIVLLDACRNNPFAASMQVSSQTRSIGRGLSRVEAASGTLISFAAKEGRVADDGDGRNSPFTAALLANLGEPGVEIGFLFRKVRDSVLAATNGTQEPYVSASLPGNAIFLVQPQAVAPPATGPGPVAGVAPQAAPPPSILPPGPVDPNAPLSAGEAVVTHFSGTAGDGAGGAGPAIDPEGAVATIVDLRAPGTSPRGQRLTDVPRRRLARAADVGQVFGTALADTGGSADVYLAATSAYGLHRTSDNRDWQSGMWGAGGGPGTIWVLREADGYEPKVFAEVTLDGRANSGPALGNLAIDRLNRQLFVSDLETGMIHRFGLDDGAELGRFDHGLEGRAAFFDVPSGLASSLPPAGFDPASAARIDDCPSGEFETTPACWNVADFRRRVWGLAVRNDAVNGTTRLFYATWGSDGLINPDWSSAGDDQRNAVWSVGVRRGGAIDREDVRREFFLPDFFTSPQSVALFGRSNPVTDIAFSACGEQEVMVVAERGGLPGSGLGAGAPFARPHESRVLRYQLGATGDWELAGRYDAGFYDRAREGPPHIRADAGGGVSFGPGFDGNWRAGAEIRNGMLWATGDALCSPQAACFAPDTGTNSDAAVLHGLQGAAPELISEVSPEAALQSYPPNGPATPAEASSASFMVAVGDPTGTRPGLVGDVAVYHPCPKDELSGTVAIAEIDPDAGWPDDIYPDTPFPEEAFPGGYDPGDFPDLPGGWEGWSPRFDLALGKSGPAECQEGAVCRYRIEVQNRGPDPYSGGLAVSDQMPAGALLHSASPGWICNAFFGTVRCQRDTPVVLAPFTSEALHIALRLPMAVAGISVENCAAIDWNVIGDDDGPGDANDGACVATPVAAGFDLGIAKSGQSASCGAGGQCLSVIEVTNHGPGEFSGTLAVAETLPAGTTLASASGEWGCSQSGETLSCTRPKTLVAGESVTLTLGLVYPLATPDGPLENCARIDFAAMTADDGPADAAPDEACDTVDIHHDGFDLEISKIGPSQCDDGGLCQYRIEITNHGPNDFVDPLAFVDARPAGAAVASMPAGGWFCGPGAAPEETACNLPAAVIGPGESRTAEIEYQLPAPVGAETVESCASLDWSAMPLDLPGDANDQSCATTNIGDGFDLSVAKAGAEECVEGAICPYSLTVENVGTRPFEGRLALSDILPANASVVAASPGWTCAPGTGADEVACRTNENVSVLAGASAVLELDVSLPETIVVDTIENCASLDLPEMGFSADAGAGNDGPSCAASAVLEADVALIGGTTCRIGEPCHLGVTMQNRGGRAFEGLLAINGSLDPAVAIQTVTPPGSGWLCEITGPGSYRCGRTTPLRLEPGDARKLRLVAAIPEEFDRSHLIHRMWITWPQSGKRDRDAGNDATVSFVRIEQAPEPDAPSEEPVPPPQAEPEPRPEPVQPDLAISKAGPGQCTTGRDCTWSIAVTNNGPGTYRGVLFVDDSPPGGSRARLVDSSPGWRCEEAGGRIGCRRGFSTLGPGQSARLDLTLRLPGEADAYEGLETSNPIVQNCAAIMRPIGARPHGMRPETGAVFAIQHALVISGFLEPGGVDGLSGPATRAAIGRYQTSRGLPATGSADERTVETMLPLIPHIAGDAVGGNDADCTVTRLAGIRPPGSDCAPDERWTGRSCVPICRDDQRWTGQRCEPLCGSGERWTGRICVPICRDDQRWNGERCEPLCRSGERWTGRSCVPICRDDQRWDGQRCVSRCGPGERFDGRRCESICGQGERWNGRQCVSQCGPGERFDGRRCVSVCGKGERWNGRQCVSQCGPDERFDGRRCVDLCGKGESWDGRRCVPQCGRGERFDGKRCVSACRDNQRFDPRTGRCLPILKLPDRVVPRLPRPEIQPRPTPQTKPLPTPQIEPAPRLQIQPDQTQRLRLPQIQQQFPNLQIR